MTSGPAPTGVDPFPRLADALIDVSSRLTDISTELRSLNRLQSGPQQPVAARSPMPVPMPVQPVPVQPVPAATPPTSAERALAHPGAPGSAPSSQPYYQPWWSQPTAQPGRRSSGQATPRPAQQPPYQQQQPPQQPPIWAPTTRSTPAPTGPTLWERLSSEGAGSRFLAWIGGVVTLAGVVLLLVLAIQRGYIGPLPRVLLGGVLGAALSVIGIRLHASEAGRIGAHAVTATGLAVVYLDIVAATSLYHYLPSWAGLIAALGIAVGGISLASHWDSQLFAGYVVVCCALSAPVLTGGVTPLLLGFLLVLQIAATPVQLAKRWSVLALVAGVPPVLDVLLSISLSHSALNLANSDVDARTTAILCLITSLIQIVIATVTAHLRPGDNVAFGLLLSGPVPTMLAVAVVARFEAAGLLAAVAVLLALVWILQRARVLLVSGPFATAAGGAGVLAVLEASCLALDGSARAMALLGGGVLLAVLAARTRYAPALVASAVFSGVGLLLALVSAVRPAYLSLAPVGTLSSSTVVTAGMTGALLAVTALTLCWAATRLAPYDSHRDAPVAWGFAGVIALYGATGAVLSIGLAISPDRHGFLIGHVMVTLSWTVGALVLLLRCIGSTPLRVIGLALVGAALTKLVAFDLASLDGISRVVAFLAAGLVLLAAGARYAKLVAARTATSRPAL